MIFISLIFLLLIILYFIHWRTLQNFEKYKKINGPVGIPFLGTVYHFIFDDVRQLQNRTIDMFRIYGDTYKVYCSWQYIVITMNPKVAEDILSATNKNMEKNYLYSLLRPWLKEGLLLSVDHKWHNRRKIITPAFHFKILESFIPIFEQQSDILVRKIKNLNLNEHDGFDIHDFIARLALDSVAETSMGIKPHAQTSDDCGYVTAVRNMCHCLTERFIRFYWQNDFLCFFTNNSLYCEYKKILKDLHIFTEKIILERRTLLERTLENKEIDDEINEFGQKKRMVFLDVLLRSTIDGKPLTNSDIQEEVDTFMFEGHDTTTSGLCFTLYLISRHPEIQKKVFNEIVEIIGKDKDKSIGYRELQDLKYLELVIKESLRMYPPVALLGRVITEDSEINGVLYPKGTDVVIHLQQMMRNPDIFENPNEFIPERHCESNYLNENPFAYIPFSAGPRNCVGQKFAMLELKSVIAKILRNFELLPKQPDIDDFVDIILKSATGFHMGFKPRSYT